MHKDATAAKARRVIHAKNHPSEYLKAAASAVAVAGVSSNTTLLEQVELVICRQGKMSNMHQ